MLLFKELEADDGELTRTRKVRRSVVNTRYKPLIDALYKNVKQANINTEVTYEDGRKGKIKASMEIREIIKNKYAKMKAK